MKKGKGHATNPVGNVESIQRSLAVVGKELNFSLANKRVLFPPSSREARAERIREDWTKDCEGGNFS